MGRKRRQGPKKLKKKKLDVPTLDHKIENLFKRHSAQRFDAKGIIGKLKLSNTKDAVLDSLRRLEGSGKIRQTRQGKYRLVLNSSGSNTHHVAQGKIEIIRSGAAYVILDDEISQSDVFIKYRDVNQALHGDTVEIEWQISRKGKPEGRVIRVVERKQTLFMGQVMIHPNGMIVHLNDDRVPFDVQVESNELSDNVRHGAHVIVHVINWPKRGGSLAKGVLKTVFGEDDSNDMDMNQILIQKGFNLTFPDDVLDENKQIAETIDEAEIDQRKDLRHITTFTIDPATAKDFDDALSIEFLDNGNLSIGVHIADVTHYVASGSALDREAAKRTTSVYLVDRVLPMLPEKLSNGVCSLRPNEEKLTFSAIFEMDRAGDIISEWFGKTVIYSDRRFTYEEAQEILETKKGPFANELNMLNSMAHTLRKHRFKTGAIQFESPEVRFKLDDNAKPIEVYVKERKDAHMLVEDFMLLANKRVGALLSNQLKKSGIEWPMIYRVHDEPDMEKVTNFSAFANAIGYKTKITKPNQVKSGYAKLLKESSGKPEQKVLQQLAIRTMAKAAYSSDNIGHYGLGFDTYSHFTSPIRRYADVIAHRILQDLLTDSNKRMNKAKLEELCKHISKKEKDAMEAERESIKYKQAEFLEAHVGEEFQGFLTGIADHGIYVTIAENHCEGMIRNDRSSNYFQISDDGFYVQTEWGKVKMGDSITIRVLASNKKKKQIDFALVGI